MGHDHRNPSRREVLIKMVGAGGAMLLVPGVFRAADVDPRIEKIISGTISVDMHNHISIPFAKTPADAWPDPELDLAGEMKRAGLSVSCHTYAVDSLRDAQPGEYYRYHLQNLDFMDRLLAKSQMRRAYTMKDLQTAHDLKQPIIIQNAEGCQFLEGHLDRVAEAYARGMRHFQLLHSRPDLVAPLGDIQSTAPSQYGGLTSFGAEVVKECNRLGMVVDLAHGTYETVLGALKVAKQPLTVTHSAMNSPTGRGNAAPNLYPRLLSREYAKAVADAGGIVGIWRLFDTTKGYVAAVKEMVDVIGVDHVGIGTDTELTQPTARAVPYTNKIWPDQNGGFLYAVVGEMLAQGFHQDEIAKIVGGNYCRLFDQVTAGHA